MATLDYQIVTGADDGYTASDGSNFIPSSASIESGRWTGSYFWTWFRFQNVTIPRYVIITSAKLSVYTKTLQGNPPGSSTTIFGVKEADPAAPTDYSEYIGASHTTEYVEWPTNNPLNQWVDSPDITDVIQELVDANDYSDGAAMMFQERFGGATKQYRQCWAYDGSPSVSCKLHIEYYTTLAPSTGLPENICILTDGGFTAFHEFYDDPMDDIPGSTVTFDNLTQDLGLRFAPKIEERDQSKQREEDDNGSE